MPLDRQSDTYQITWLIRRLFRALGQKSTQNIATFDVTVADRAVMEFLYPDKQFSVPEIATRYQVSRQHIQMTMNSLLAKQFVEQIKNPKHKRSSLFALSKQGIVLFDAILATDLVFIESMFSGVSKSHQVTTRSVLEQLLKHLD